MAKSKTWYELNDEHMFVLEDVKAVSTWGFLLDTNPRGIKVLMKDGTTIETLSYGTDDANLAKLKEDLKVLKSKVRIHGNLNE